MTFQKFALGDRITDGFKEKIKSGVVWSNIEKKIHLKMEEQLALKGFGKDGLVLEKKINETSPTR